MSIESSQFARMVREAVKSPPATDFTFKFCENCSAREPHVSEQVGTWETFTCTRCRRESRYRTR